MFRNIYTQPNLSYDIPLNGHLKFPSLQYSGDPLDESPEILIINHLADFLIIQTCVAAKFFDGYKTIPAFAQFEP